MLERQNRLLEPFHRHYETWATRIGLVGNSLFVLGSILFLFSPSLAAKLCWLLGSLGMLVRVVGRRYSDRRANQERFHERQEGAAMTAARRELDTAPE